MNPVNPLASFRDAYGTLEGLAQDRTRRQAGQAFARGDYQGASGALAQRGMLDEAQGVTAFQQGQEDRGARQQQAQAEAQRQQAAERVTWTLNAVEALKRQPPERRHDYYVSQVVPTLRSHGVPDDALAQIQPDHLDDQTLDGFATMLGGEAHKMQLFQGKDGSVAAYDPANPKDSWSTIREAPPADPLDAQYRQAQIDYLRAGVGARGASAEASHARAIKTRSGGGKSKPGPRDGGSGPEPVW